MTIQTVLGDSDHTAGYIKPSGIGLVGRIGYFRLDIFRRVNRVGEAIALPDLVLININERKDDRGTAQYARCALGTGIALCTQAIGVIAVRAPEQVIFGNQ